MAVFTRTNGNGQNVISVGVADFSTAANSVNVVISTGIGKPVQAWSINCASALTANVGTGQAVESILRTIGLNSTVLAYEIGNAALGGVTNGLLSVLTEDSSWNATDLQANIRAISDSSGYTYTGTFVGGPNAMRFITTAGA